MVSYSDIPPDTILICPKCKAKNMRTDSLCRNCEASLDDVKRALLAQLAKEQSTGPPLTMEYVRSKASESKERGTCVVCGDTFEKWTGTASSGTCSFCGGRMCIGCMRPRRHELKEPMLSHLVRFGLQPFPGMTSDSGLLELFVGVPAGPSVLLSPGYYLCENCEHFLNGPGFVAFAKDFYERTGRTEELAELYETQGMLDEAKRIRIGARSRSPADLNRLIDKLREGGLAIPYKCPSCGANITIDKDSKSEGLRFCSYCGTAVNIDALVKALESDFS